jgi:hypothetical protein
MPCRAAAPKLIIDTSRRPIRYARPSVKSTRRKSMRTRSLHRKNRTHKSVHFGYSRPPWIAIHQPAGALIAHFEASTAGDKHPAYVDQQNTQPHHSHLCRPVVAVDHAFGWGYRVLLAARRRGVVRTGRRKKRGESPRNPLAQRLGHATRRCSLRSRCSTNMNQVRLICRSPYPIPGGCILSWRSILLRDGFSRQFCRSTFALPWLT